MSFSRVIPVLLLRRKGLVKTVRFREPSYVGDPINTVRIFNEKEVDELVFLDITCTRDGGEPQFDLIEQISRECFMPFAYGGGLRTLEQIQQVLARGAEKALINTAAFTTPELVTQAAERFGSQSIVVSIDVQQRRQGLLGGKRDEVIVGCGQQRTRSDPVDYARQMVERGAGELLLTSIDRDGTFTGYDLDLVRRVTDAVDVPVVACGGAGNLQHMVEAIDAGATGAGSGSVFVYQGAHRSVLINYPERAALDELFGHETMV
jgi:cyclase